MITEVLILACSAKHHQYCVAGIDLSTGKWIRLVSTDHPSNNAIPLHYLYYEDHRRCTPLDVVLVDIERPVPGTIQQENVLVNMERRLQFAGRVSTQALTPYLTTDSYIYMGTSSYMYETHVSRCRYSLGLFRVSNVELNKITDGERSRYKVSFVYNGRQYYDMSMTDPDYYDQESHLICEEGYIVVSIPEDDYNGKYYKFVSKIFEL